jgi:tetratricopeptide (TPR) repeat protein
VTEAMIDSKKAPMLSRAVQAVACAAFLGAVALFPAAPIAAKDVDEKALEARIAAGDSLRMKGALDEAMREYVAALAIDDESCEANYGMARIALAREDVAAAELHAERAAEEADCDLGLVATALVRIAQGKLDEAEAALYKVGTRDLPNETRIEVEWAFVTLYKSKQYPLLVVEHLDKIIPLVEDKAPLLIEKGRLLVEEKKYDDALTAFRAAIAADSTAVDAYKEISTLYLRAKRPADAAEVLTRLADVTKNVDAYLMAGEAWSTAERPAEARAAYQKAAELDSTSTTAWLGLARSSFQTGDREAALAAYRNLGPTKVLGAQDNMNVGRVLLEDKQYQEAREAFERAVALDSTLTDAHFFIGNAYFGEKKYAEAVPHYEKAVALDPTRAAAQVNLGQALIQSGNVTRGIAALEQAVTLRPDDHKTRLYLAQSLASQTHWSKAVQHYQAILAAEPDNADALRGLGYCHLSQERYGDAISVLSKANTIEPGNVQGLVWLAQGYGMAGELDKSESTFRKVLAIDPSSQEAKTGLDTLEKSKRGKRRSG